jgi:hypothetical protein
MRWALTSLLWVACSGDGGDPPLPPLVDCDSPGQVCTFAGTGDRGWSDDGGLATETALFLPTDMTFDVDGQPLIVDYNNMRILRMERDDTLHTIVGMGVHAYASDGVDALDTPLENPVSMAVGSDGTLFITEQHGARILSVVDGWLEVYAGSATDPGVEAWTGDGGPALDARMSQSVGLTIGPDDTLYIADTGNHCLRMVRPDGTIEALAGSGARQLGDGTGADASFSLPQHIAYHDGHVYVADTANHAVRRVDVATGEVATVAGNGKAGFSGDGGPATEAQLDTPQGVGVDAEGRVYIADSENHVVRRVELDGTLSTFVGVPGVADYTGDGGPRQEATLHWPVNVTVGPDGSVYVLDTLNSVIRRVAP